MQYKYFDSFKKLDDYFKSVGDASLPTVRVGGLLARKLLQEDYCVHDIYFFIRYLYLDTYEVYPRPRGFKHTYIVGN